MANPISSVNSLGNNNVTVTPLSVPESDSSNPSSTATALPTDEGRAIIQPTNSLVNNVVQQFRGAGQTLIAGARRITGATATVVNVVRNPGAAAGNGLVDGAVAGLLTNEAEITLTLRDIVRNLLLLRIPENYHLLLRHIDNFQNSPCISSLNQIRQLLPLDRNRIFDLAPEITDQQVEPLIRLTGILNGVNAENLSNLNTSVLGELEAAKAILKKIIEDHEGIAIQVMTAFTQSLHDPCGPLAAVRDQLTHPQTGIVHTVLEQIDTQIRNNMAELHQALLNPQNGMVRNVVAQIDSEVTTIRTQIRNDMAELCQALLNPQNGMVRNVVAQIDRALTARAAPQLRATIDALEVYRTALNPNANPDELRALLTPLREKIELLLSRQDLVPQVTTEQWAQLQEFNQLIQVQISNSLSLPAASQLLTESETPNQIITTAFNAQRGIAEEVAAILVRGLREGTEHLEQLPQRMLNRALSSFFPEQTTPSQPGAAGTTPPTDAPTSPPNTSTPGQPAAPTSASTSAPAQSPIASTIGGLFTRGRAFLDSLLSSAGEAASQYAAKSLAMLTKLAFEKAHDYVMGDLIRQRGAPPDFSTTISALIARLQAAITSSSWTELTRVLSDAFAFLQTHDTYLQGIRLPLNPARNHTSAIPSFLNTINAHRDALRSPFQQNPNVTPTMIERQADLLKVRSASYGPARLVAEKICGIKHSAEFYAKIYRRSSNPQNVNLSPIFRQRLFQEIDKTKLNVFRKWIAKRAYDLLHPLSTFYIRSIVSGVLKQIQNWIRPDLPSQESKDDFLIKLLRNWMAVMSGAYNQVANTPFSQAKDFSIMMEETLKIPARNGGLTQQRLYAAVGKTALDTFGPRIRWNETIDNYFKTEIPHHSPLFFLNPVAKALNTFCSYCLKGIVFAPQWLGNQILQGGAKLALTHTPFLKDYSEQTVDSLRRNTPSSYAIQRMIFRQQQKVLERLQNTLNTDSPSNGLLNRNTNIKKIEITGLVEYGLEILNKGRYRTQDRLHNYLNHRASLRDRVGHELEETFLPDVMESAVSTISIAVQAMTEEEEMKQMLYDGLQIANDAFDVQQPVSDEDFIAIERGIREMTDQILETAIYHAIGEKFDFTNTKQKTGITAFNTTLKTKTLAFSLALRRAAEEISSGAVITAADLQSKITSMIKTSADYNRDRVDALSLADGNRHFHMATKSHFNQVSLELSTYYTTPLSTILNQIKGKSDAMLAKLKLSELLQVCQNIQECLREKLQHPQLSPNDLAFCKPQISLLKQHLMTLRRQSGCPPDLLEEIQRRCDEFSRGIQSTETLQKTEGILIRSLPLFENLQREKQSGTARPSPQLKTREKQLCDLLNTLPLPQQKTQLMGLVASMMLATRPDAVSSNAAQFLSSHWEIQNRNSSEANRQLESLRSTRELLESRLSADILQFNADYARDQGDAQTKANELVTLIGPVHLTHTGVVTRIGSPQFDPLTPLDAWVLGLADLQIWDLFSVDMHWAEEIAKNLAFDRAKAKMQELFDALYQRHNYVGFVNQVALLPFVQRFGKHHLKT
jgi:hypothetical protein